MSAGQHGVGQTLDKALEHDAVIVIGIVHHGKVDQDPVSHFASFQQRQNGEEILRPVIRQGVKLLSRLSDPAPDTHQTAELFHCLMLCPGAQLPDAVQVLFADGLIQRGLCFLRQTQPPGGLFQHTQVGKLQHTVLRHGAETFYRKSDHIADVLRIHPADALKSCLHDLPKTVCALRDPVHIFVVEQLLQLPGLILAVFDDGESHVRL